MPPILNYSEDSQIGCHSYTLMGLRRGLCNRRQLYCLCVSQIFSNLAYPASCQRRSRGNLTILIVLMCELVPMSGLTNPDAVGNEGVMPE